MNTSNPKSGSIRSKKISTPRMVLKIFKLFFFSLFRLRFYIPGVPEIKPDDLYDRFQSDQPPLIIDTRDKNEFYGNQDLSYGAKYGHIPDAKLLPLFQLPDNLVHLSQHKDTEIVTICPGGGASLIACEIMIKAGFTNVKSLRGGMNKWHKKGYPTTTDKNPEDTKYFIEIRKDDPFLNKAEKDGKYTGEVHKTLDARNMSCPKPILLSKKAMNKMETNQILEIFATDPASTRDIPSWASVSGHELISAEDNKEEFRFIIKKIK